jgi:hypothetical protein
VRTDKDMLGSNQYYVQANCCSLGKAMARKEPKQKHNDGLMMMRRRAAA